MAEPIVLHGYVSNVEHEPEPPSNGIDWGEQTLDSWSELHSRLGEYAAEAAKDGIPRWGKVVIRGVGSAPGVVFDVITYYAEDVANGQDGWKATITGIGATVIDIFIGGAAGAAAGAIVGGGVPGAVVGFIVGAYIGGAAGDFADEEILDPLYDDFIDYFYDPDRNTLRVTGKDAEGNIEKLSEINFEDNGAFEGTTIYFDESGTPQSTQNFESNGFDKSITYESPILLDNNASAAPGGTNVGENQFYVSDGYNNYAAVAVAFLLVFFWQDIRSHTPLLMHALKIKLQPQAFSECVKNATPIPDGGAIGVCESHCHDDGYWYTDLPYAEAIIYDSSDQIVNNHAHRSRAWNQTAYTTFHRKARIYDTGYKATRLFGHYYYVYFSTHLSGDFRPEDFPEGEGPYKRRTPQEKNSTGEEKALTKIESTYRRIK